jgi:hypothetical protein
MKEVKDGNGASHKAEQRRNQRDSPVHRLEHLIEEQRHNDIAGVRDETDSVAIEYKLAANQELAKSCRQKEK